MHSNRRQFLRGLSGITIALPFFASLRPRALWAQSAPPVRRMVVFFQCNGVDKTRFWPTQSGALTSASLAGTALEPLIPMANKILVARGIDQSPAANNGSPGNDHEKGIGSRLTASTLSGDDNHYALGLSADQLAARQINVGGRAALTLKVHEAKSGVLGCISYAGANQPVVGEPNPANAFRNLVGLQSSGPAAASIHARRKSVLDFVRADIASLKPALAQADRTKLDLHLTSLRDIEVGLDQVGLLDCKVVDTGALSTSLSQIDPITVTTGAEFKRVGLLQMDMIAAALACDQTRVATLLWGAGAGGPVFQWDGLNHLYNHHKLSHGSTADDSTGQALDGAADMIHEIDTWYAKQFAYLLARLDSYSESTGTLLDNSVVAWLNDLSDGKAHDATDLPVVIGGSGAGYLKQGTAVTLASAAGHNQLLTTVLNAVGVREPGGGPLLHFGGTAEGQMPGEIDSLKR